MNIEAVSAVKTAVEKTNRILKACNQNTIDATEIKIFFTDLSMEQIADDRQYIFNDDDITDAIYNNYENLDIRKLMFYCYHKIHNLPEVIKKTNNEIKEFENILYKLSCSYIPANQNVTIYTGNVSADGSRYEIDIINSNNELYNKQVKSKKLRLDNLYESIIDLLEFTDIPITVKDNKLAQTIQCYIGYNTLSKTSIKKDDIIKIYEANFERYSRKPEFREYFAKFKREIYLMPDIQNNLEENNLYAIALCRLTNQLNLCAAKWKNNIKQDFITIPFLNEMNNVFYLLYNNVVGRKLTISIETEEGVEDINPENYLYEWKNSIEELSKKFISENPIQAYNPQILHLLSKDSAMELLEKQENKAEFYFAMYQSKHISFKEMLEYEESIDPESIDGYRIRALILKLTRGISIPKEIKSFDRNNKSESDEEPPTINKNTGNKGTITNLYKPENFFSITLDDNSLYEMMNPYLFRIFAYNSIKQIKENGNYSKQARKNIDVMVKNKKLTPDIIVSLYIYNDITIDDLQNTIGKDKLEELYDANDFIDTYKKMKEYTLKDNLSEEENITFEILQGEYRFYCELYKKYGYLGDEDKEVELLDYLGDLIDDKQVLKELYLDELISIDNLDGLNRELCIELYKDNLLRSDDKKYIILHTNADINIGDLIRLSNDGNISTKEVFNLYMQEKISLNMLKDYAEGINTDEIFNDNDLINKAKRFSIVNEKDIANDFQRYILAYTQIKGEPSADIKSKLYKAIGGKNAKLQNVIDLYNRGMIDIKDVDINNTKLLIEMIKQGNLKADDEFFLFRDTEKDGKKYLRLTKILPFLTSDQRINILASVYGKSDEISNPRVKFLSSYLDEAVEEKNSTSNGPKITKNASKDKQKDTSIEKTKNLFAFGEKFNTFKEIDSNYKHEVASGSYIIYFKELNTVILEEIYRTTSTGNDFYNTQHATYILKGTSDVYRNFNLNQDNDFYDELKDKIIFQNSKGVSAVDWSKVIQMHRDKVNGISKCLHTTEERWKNTLKKKIGVEDPKKQEKIEQCLEKIENTTLDINNQDVDNNDIDY